MALGALVTRKALRALRSEAYPELAIAREAHPVVFSILFAVNALSAFFLFGFAVLVAWVFFNPLVYT
jgi:hypothetical protein